MYHIREDLNFFKEITLGKTCVMGRKTYESLPKKKLPNRKIIILSTDENYKGLYEEQVITNIEDVKEISKQESVIVCGGKYLYEYFEPFCDTKYISVIQDKNLKTEDEMIYLNLEDFLKGKKEVLKTIDFEEKELNLTIYKITK